MVSERTMDGGRNTGTWYLAQAADGAWRIHARSEAALAPARVLAELSAYPAVVTTNGNLFHLGMPLVRLLNLRSH